MKFQEHFIPDREIAINESITEFKDKISFLTYNLNKQPIKQEICIYMLSDIYIYIGCYTYLLRKR